MLHSAVTCSSLNLFAIVSWWLCDIIATAFLEFWKRREAVHQYDWDIMPADDVERVRPQFEIMVKYRKVNPITQVRLVLYSVMFVK